MFSCSGNSSGTPWNLPTNFHPDQIATAPQTSLLSLNALLFRKPHLFPICVVLTYNDSRIGLQRLCQILGNCQCKGLLASSSAPRTFVNSFLFPETFWFCTVKVDADGLRALGPHTADNQAHPGATTFPPEGSVNAEAQLFSTPAHTLSGSTITDSYARAGWPQRLFTLPLRRPDCTLSRLSASTSEEYDRPVTQSKATPEPGCQDRAAAHKGLECLTTPGSRRTCPG